MEVDALVTGSRENKRVPILFVQLEEQVYNEHLHLHVHKLYTAHYMYDLITTVFILI